MSEIPVDLTYTKEHEYLKKTSEEAIYQLGITDFAQGELGDVVFVELPEAGTTLEPMEPFGTIEAVKAVSDLYCPVRGDVVEVNAALVDDPSLVNSDPYGDGWMIRVRVADEGALSGCWTERATLLTSARADPERHGAVDRSRPQVPRAAHGSGW